MTILEIADEIMKAAKGDGRTAVVLALLHCSSRGFIRAAPLSAADLELDDGEPLDVDRGQSSRE